MEQLYKRLGEADEAWDEHYKSLAGRSKRRARTEAEKARNMGLNRYKDFLPNDDTRVKLERTSDTDYINASYVFLPKASRKYILTQGPLPDTIVHFWTMAWEQKSRAVVMLNTTAEVSFGLCEPYWPESADKPTIFDKVNLKVSLKSIQDNKLYTVRELTLEDTSSGEQRNVLHYHYTGWSDCGAPDSPISFLRLLAAVRKSGGLDNVDEPCIVHCSAGIGRSGTFCLIDSILAMVENQGSTEGISIESVLTDMREHRYGLIQSTEQLKFSYTTILYGKTILEKANMLRPHSSPTKDDPPQDISSQPSSTSDSGGAPSQSGTSSKRTRGASRRKQGDSSIDTHTPSLPEQHLLVAALDDVDSDTADELFYSTMMIASNVKKRKSSPPDEGSMQLDSSRLPTSSDQLADDPSINVTVSVRRTYSPTIILPGVSSSKFSILSRREKGDKSKKPGEEPKTEGSKREEPQKEESEKEESKEEKK